MEHLPQTVRYCRRFCYKYGVLAIIASADDPESIEDWAKSNHAYLKHYLELPHGIPSHDTFQRVLEKVKPNSFQKCFNEWIEGIRVQNKMAVNISPSTARKTGGAKARFVASAHFTSSVPFRARMAFRWGKLCVRKSNKIITTPGFLGSIDVTNSIITTGVIVTQTKNVAKIIEKADMFWLSKTIAKKLHKVIRALFEATDLSCRKVSRHIEEEIVHGRETKREYYNILLPKDDATREKWAGLHTAIMTIRTHQKKDGSFVTEKQYYISSLGKNAKLLSQNVRGHWGIEL